MTLRSKAFFWLALTFLVGCLLGGGMVYLLQDSAQASRGERKPPSPEEMVAHLDREAQLELDAAQSEKLEGILRLRGEQMDEETRRSKEEIRRIRSEVDVQIRQILSEEQVRKFDQFKAEWRKKHPRKDGNSR